MFGLKAKMFGGERRVCRQETGGGWGSCIKTGVPGMASGMIAGTRVATAMGWRPVEAIMEHDLVLTFDRGLQPVRGVIRGTGRDAAWPCPDTFWPLQVPAGALGNGEALHLLPEQPVMVESDLADLLFGDPFQLIEAAVLDGLRGIRRDLPAPALPVVQLCFEHEELIFAANGALLFCPGQSLVEIAQAAEVPAEQPSYGILPRAEAKMLVQGIAGDDAARLHHGETPPHMARPLARCA